MKETYIVTGMSCSSCSAHVEKAVSGLNGILSVSVNLLSASMVVEYNEDKLSSAKIIDTVISAGYGAKLKSGSNASDGSPAITHNRQKISKSLMRLIISATLLLILVYVSMGHMIGLKLPGPISKDNPIGFSVTQLILSCTIIFINRNFYISGLKSALRAAPNMDTLVSLGSAASLIYSIVRTVQMFFYVNTSPAFVRELTSDLYYESAAMILVFISVGRLIEEKSKYRTRDAVRELIALRPDTAIVLKDGVESVIACSEIKNGDTILVRPGMTIPADGEIISGSGEADESALTGESLPVIKNTGDKVYTATINVSGSFTFRVTSSNEETVFAKIIEKVEQAAASKAPIARLADKISLVFVPTVIGISIITFIIHMVLQGSVGYSLTFAIAVLVVSCPCSLGLATPVAVMTGTGRAAKAGILFKSAEVLENTASVDTIVFDKTGTVTKGNLSVTDIVPSEGCSVQMLIKTAFTAEIFSEHPIARAVAAHAEKYLTDEERSELSDNLTDNSFSFSQIPGGGICLTHNEDRIEIGNIRYICPSNEAVIKICDRFASLGKTPIVVSRSGIVSGVIALTDVIRENALLAFDSLKSSGINTHLLSGDNAGTVEYIAGQININNYKSEVTPTEKLEYIYELNKKGRHTAMVGDGINDAPALTGADVGVAIGGGTDIAISSADIVLTGSDPLLVCDMLKIASKTMRIIKQNLFWALFYNCLGIPVAAGVLYSDFGIKLSPMLASAMMSCSSIFVVVNALRLKNIRLHDSETTERTDEMKETNDKKNVTVGISGMMCMHCVAFVTKAFTAAGIDAKVSLENNNAVLRGAEDISDDRIKSIVTEAGYEVTYIER